MAAARVTHEAPDPPVVYKYFLSGVDFAWVLEILRAGGHGTISGALNTALWNYARQLGLDPPSEILSAAGRPRGVPPPAAPAPAPAPVPQTACRDRPSPPIPDPPTPPRPSPSRG